MSRCNDMFVSSTYWSDPISATAALATVREYKRRHVQDYLWSMGRQYKEAFNPLAQEYGVPARFDGMDCNFTMKWSLEDASLFKPAMTFWVQECNKRGIFPGPGAHMSWAHKREDLDYLVPRWKEILEQIRIALDSGDLPARLEAEIGREAFRRLVS